PFYTMQVKSMNKQMELIGRYGDVVTTIKGIDELIVNAGNRPDFSIEQELRLSIDPVTESVLDLAPLIDPNEHSCGTVRDRKSTRLNSSHVSISYAVFCLKKKKNPILASARITT